MLYPVTQNPLIRVLDICGRDFASHLPAPMPEIMGPKTGQLRSSQQMALENGFSSLSDLQCRLAEIRLGGHSQLMALSQWYYTDGSKGGLQALINSQYRFFAPETL